MAWSPDGKQLASGSGDQTIIIWDAASGKPQMTLTGHMAAISSVAWSRDGKQLASGSLDQTVKLWDVANGKLQATLTGDASPAFSVAFTESSQDIYNLFGSGHSDGNIVVYEMPKATVKAKLKGHTDSVYRVAWSPDGKQLASGSGDKTVKIWDVASAK